MPPASNVSTFICFDLSALLVYYHLVFRSTSSIDSWIGQTDTFASSLSFCNLTPRYPEPFSIRNRIVFSLL